MASSTPTSTLTKAENKAPISANSNLRKANGSRSKLGSLNLQQELTTFGRWVDSPILVPPKDCSGEMAKTLLNQFGPLASKDKCWAALTAAHRSEFTQVREFELPRASIRLPQGRIYVTVTEQKDFGNIEEQIPRSVQMRLDEFLEQKGNRRGIKVYYLKPLCVERDSQLIFTSREQIDAAIDKIQGEVFAEYRKRYLSDRMQRFVAATINASLAVPRSLMKSHLERRRREIEGYHSKLEFERRRRALAAAREHNKLRSTGCTFDEMLAMSDSPAYEDVIEHYIAEKELKARDRKMFLLATAANLPWFATLSVGIANLVTAYLTTGLSIAVCDPAFVVEMPDSNGELLKIGHFDEVDGVMHVEI